MMSFTRNCPDCGTEMSYTRKGSLKRAIENNRKCYSCCQKGNKNATGERSDESKINISLGKGGEGILHNSPFNYYKLGKWSKAVKERDDYICQHCYLDGIPGTGEIEAHHIVSKSLFPQYAYDLDNGQSLCRECHFIEHQKRPNDPWRAS
jgi:hypothetical protein